ncbi:MAG: ATP-binding protein [Elusimicrobia bacterium]|nr:ATP-binding protein [Elusimicrobiota bacterium]
MKRNIDKTLLTWKNGAGRKALLVRGARQVGKTYSVRVLGKRFKYFLEVNFEEHKDISGFFEGSLDIEKIIQKLSAFFSVPIIDGETLLFFDEIQACPNALRALRFFYEKRANLHVVGAGSLLEFVLSDIPSYGVGRIESLRMYPLSFDEFLLALNKKQLLEIKRSNAFGKLDQIFHNELLDLVKLFLMIGGMPEVVEAYLEKSDIGLCFRKINDLIISFQDDFRKYKTKMSSIMIKEVFNSIVLQSGYKFKYSNIDSQSAHISLKKSLEILIQSGLAYKVYHSSAQGIPLGGQIKANKFKVIFFDSGIHLQMLGLDLKEILVSRDIDLINKGSLAEVFVGNELIKYLSRTQKKDIYYWHRESRASNAEVDYVIQKGMDIIPIEVKSGIKGKMQSLRLFLSERKIKKGVRLSLDNFSIHNGICNYPLYAVSNLVDEDS